MTADRVWHKGPPPHVGWWNASPNSNKAAWRWWDGENWSEAAFEDFSPQMASACGNLKTTRKSIPWTDYWPENARVPRLDPTGGHWTFNVDGVQPKTLPQRIDVVLRCADILKGLDSRFWDWELDDVPFDILAWRPAA